MSLPIEALKSHIAILGKTGSGKTYTARGIVEGLLRDQKRVCIIDPTGAWWGLKSSADGDSAGFPVVIFGGEHADVPINEHAGSALGELVGSNNLPCIIDLSGTMLAERRRFMTAFAEHLYRTNRQPLHLIIDEADEFSPQDGAKGAEHLTGHMDRIVRRGRSRGFRVMLITQRAAVLNKNVLTQCNTLIAMRTPAPQDRAAVKAWITGQADEEEGKAVLGSLSKLNRGEGWIWAPEQGVLERTQFPENTTFDSGRTPDDGEAIESPKTLAEIDLTSITTALEAATQEARANDPRVLREEIKTLKEQLAQKPEGTQAVTEGVVSEGVEREMDELRERARLDYVALQDLHKRAELAEARLEAMLTRSIERTEVIRERGEALRGAVQSTADSIIRLLADLREVINAATDEMLKGQPAEPQGFRLDAEPYRSIIDSAHQSVAAPTGRPKVATGDRAPKGAREPVENGHANGASSFHRRAETTPSGGRSGPEQKILDSLRWWHSIDVKQPNRAGVAMVAGYSIKSSSYQKAQSSLRTSDMVRYPDSDTIELTQTGYINAKKPATAPTLKDLHAAILEVLPGPEQKILTAIIKRRGKSVERTSIASEAGYSINSSSYQKAQSNLRTLGLVDYPHTDSIASTPILFPKSLQSH